jgi:murein L,D-transpeptidase YcbB/YkuD
LPLYVNLLTDADGIVNVSAVDKATNKEQTMTITSSSGLSDSEIERMVQESEKFAEADKAKQAVIEQSNKAESFTQEIEKNLQEFEAQLDATEKDNVKKLVAELREMAAAGLRGDEITPEALKEKYDEVSLQVVCLGPFFCNSMLFLHTRRPNKLHWACSRRSTRSVPLLVMPNRSLQPIRLLRERRRTSLVDTTL